MHIGTLNLKGTKANIQLIPKELALHNIDICALQEFSGQEADFNGTTTEGYSLYIKGSVGFAVKDAIQVRDFEGNTANRTATLTLRTEKGHRRFVCVHAPVAHCPRFWNHLATLVTPTTTITTLTPILTTHARRSLCAPLPQSHG